MMDRILLLVLFLLGLWGLVGMQNIFKKIFGLGLINSSVVLLFILEASASGTATPILEPGIVHVVDPVPQALMLTAVVVGVCITALALGLAVRLYRATGSLEMDEIRRRLGPHE